jgi:transposase
MGLKEAFRSIYRARNRTEAELRLSRFLAAVERSRIEPFMAFADGIRQWRTELLAYFDEPTTNGYAAASSTRSRSSSAAPTAYPPSEASERESS